MDNKPVNATKEVHFVGGVAVNSKINLTGNNLLEKLNDKTRGNSNSQQKQQQVIYN